MPKKNLVMLYSNCCNAPDRIIRKVLDMHFSEQGVCPECLDHCFFIEYKALDSYPNYEVGTDGSVWSLNYKQKQIRQELKACTTRKGYKAVGIAINGRCKQFLVHRLVALAFIPNPDNKATINHINSVKTDNRVENLEWATQQENITHYFLTNNVKVLCGELCVMAKLKELDVIEIRNLKKKGAKSIDLSKLYGISEVHVSSIIRYKSWKHIKPETE